MAPPHHQATTSASWILLLLVFAVALFPCSSCDQATEAGGTPPSPPPTGGYCSRTEASSLLQLFPGLNITAELPSWRLGTDCCSWEGIECERGMGHVVGLHLGERFITAHVDASKFLGLPRLSSINLSWNILDYSSSFPSVLADLSNLTHLNISMEGTLALEFLQLPRPVSLDLSPYPPAYDLKLVNGGLGTVLVNGLSWLQELHLDYVDLTDGSARWCRALAFALSKLQVLSLRRCSLSVDASCLSQLSYLSEIYPDLNDFSSGLPSFYSYFSSLRALSLSGCGLTGRVPKDLLWLPKLEILDLSSNSIIGNLPEFSPTSVLQVLTLTFTGLSGELPTSIGYLESMKELELASCNLTGQIPNSIANLGNIVSLDLSGNNLSGPIPPTLGGLNQLVLLDLSDNSLSDHIPTGMLSSSAKLEVVRLQDNQLTGPVPTPDQEKLSRLTTLNLQNNSLSGSLPSSLPSLQSLLLNKNQLGGQLEEIPNAISSILEEIDLSDNKLRGEIPSSVFKLPDLQTLSLSFNQFNGTVELSMLQNATVSKLELSLLQPVGLPILFKKAIPGCLFPRLVQQQDRWRDTEETQDPAGPRLLFDVVLVLGRFCRSRRSARRKSPCEGTRGGGGREGGEAAEPRFPLFGGGCLRRSQRAPVDFCCLPEAAVLPRLSLESLCWGNFENLGSLSFLSLSNNGLMGPFPDGLPKLAGNLQYLIIDGNPMAIELPSQLRRLTRLQELRLGNSG